MCKSWYEQLFLRIHINVWINSLLLSGRIKFCTSWDRMTSPIDETSVLERMHQAQALDESNSSGLRLAQLGVLFEKRIWNDDYHFIKEKAERWSSLSRSIVDRNFSFSSEVWKSYFQLHDLLLVISCTFLEPLIWGIPNFSPMQTIRTPGFSSFVTQELLLNTLWIADTH